MNLDLYLLLLVKPPSFLLSIAFLFGLRPLEDLHWQRHGGQQHGAQLPHAQLCFAEPEPHEFPDESGAAARPGVMTLDALGVFR